MVFGALDLISVCSVNRDKPFKTVSEFLSYLNVLTDSKAIIYPRVHLIKRGFGRC